MSKFDKILFLDIEITGLYDASFDTRKRYVFMRKTLKQKIDKKLQLSFEPIVPILELEVVRCKHCKLAFIAITVSNISNLLNYHLFTNSSFRTKLKNLFNKRNGGKNGYLNKNLTKTLLCNEENTKIQEK